MDLIRKLLLYFEERTSSAVDEEVRITGHAEDEVKYHLILLAQAGLITYEAERSKTNPARLIRVYPFGLSWAGHEFLDAARNETLWAKAKGRLVEVTGGLSLQLLEALLLHYARQQLGLNA